MMVDGFLDEMVRAEGHLELFRVALRTGLMSVEDVLSSQAVAAAADPNDPLRAAIFPESADGNARRADSETHGRTQGNVAAYRDARIRLMEARGYTYEALTSTDVFEAFNQAMANRLFV